MCYIHYTLKFLKKAELAAQMQLSSFKSLKITMVAKNYGTRQIFLCTVPELTQIGSSSKTNEGLNYDLTRAQNLVWKEFEGRESRK